MKFLQSGWKKHIQGISTASFLSNWEEKSCRKPKGPNPVLFNSCIELFHFCCSDSVQRGFKQTHLLWFLVACAVFVNEDSQEGWAMAIPPCQRGKGYVRCWGSWPGPLWGESCLPGPSGCGVIDENLCPFGLGQALLPARWQCVRGYTVAGTEACLAARELLGAWLLWAMPNSCCHFWTIHGYFECELLLAKQGWDRRLAMSCCRGAHLAKSHLCVSACTTMMCTHVSRVCTRRKKMFKNPCSAGTWGTLCLDFVWGN